MQFIVLSTIRLLFFLLSIGSSLVAVSRDVPRVYPACTPPVELCTPVYPEAGYIIISSLRMRHRVP